MFFLIYLFVPSTHMAFRRKYFACFQKLIVFFHAISIYSYGGFSVVIYSISVWKSITFSNDFSKKCWVCLTIACNAQIGANLHNATPPTNCQFVGWFIGTTQIYQYTPWTYTEDKEATAVYNYGITVQSSGPRTFTPSEVVKYYALGATPTYNFTPNSDSYIVSVIVDGVTEFSGNNEATTPYSYTFTPINTAHNIKVTFAKKFYAINPANINGGATITMSPSPVPDGQNVTFTFTAPCLEITSITIGGVPQIPVPASYTMLATAPLPLIEITTTTPQYTITATPAQGIDPMGYISPSGVYHAQCGETVTYNFITESGYRIKTLLVDGVSKPVPASNSYTFQNIDASHTIALEFEEFPKYIIQFGPSAAQQLGGVVFPTNDPDAQYYVAVDSGTLVYPFTIQPDAGYVIDKVYVDNTSIPSAVLSGTYTFTHVLTNHEIFATFKPVMFTITATADPNGTITPSGTVQVPYNTNYTFNTTPNTGYQLDKIFVDGVEDAAATAAGFYTFENVTTNHTIHATFTKKSYLITTIAGVQGTITPVNPMVLHGNNQTFYFQPSTGYVVNQVKVDGNVVPTANSYTFINVTQEHTLEVTFAKETFTITATYQGGGENSFVTPSGVATVEYDAHSEIYVFVSAEGYHVQSALIDGINDPLAVADGMYRFLNVKANHTIHVIFAKDEFTITATANEGGSITPAGVVPVSFGANKTFYFAAEAGYELARVLVDGINKEEAVAQGQFTFENVDDNHIITAQFEKKLYNVIYEEVLGAIVVPVEGSVSPVEYGGKYKFTVELQEGYTQSNLIVRANNLILTPVLGVYTINNIAADQYITINGVALNMYKITAKAHDGGTITPAGTFMVAHGDNMSFEMTPNAHYKISDLLVNGESVGAVTTYLFNDVRADGKIEVYFEYDNVGINVNDKAVITVFSHQNIITIMNENLIPVKQVEIMDMYGRLVWSGPALTERTDITLNVAKGTYAVRVVTESKQNTTKVVIQ